MAQETIEIDGETFEVEVAQTSKSVWTAAGVVCGHRLAVKGSSRTNAMTKWQEEADAQLKA